MQRVAQVLIESSSKKQKLISEVSNSKNLGIWKINKMKLSCVYQSYAWGKRGAESAVAKLLRLPVILVFYYSLAPPVV